MSVPIERVGDIAVVTVDNPPVNALNHALRRGLLDAAETLDRDPSVRAVVLLAAGRTFIAGADITELSQPPLPPHLPDVVARIEAAAKPWLAAIHGSALGGGLEVALACRWRIATGSARLGLPEVTLGIVPGAGGTVRLPRLVPLPAAVELVTGGRPISAEKAAAIGLIDAVVDGLHAGALAFVRSALQRPAPAPLIARAPTDTPDPAFWADQERAVANRARGEAAPLRALACLRRSVEAGPADALAFERETFLELRGSAQARALRHVFFAERAAVRPPEYDGVVARPLRSAGVIGGGVMGAGIAAALRDAGLPVILVERDQAALDRGMVALSALFEGAVKRGRLAPEARDARMAGVEGATGYARLADADLVIEAVFEDLAVKRQVFAALDAACRPDAVLATNTSYLDPNSIAAATARPSRVLGLHFFSPANVMRLLEIVPAADTAPDVVATGLALARTLGKVPVLAGICDGFIGNRILKVTRAQAERLLLAGASPGDVDRAMRGFGMPMGPFEAQDLAGLDIAALQRAAARRRGEAPFAPVADRLVALGRLGQKTGGGWYDYAPGDRTPRRAAAVEAVIAEEASGHKKVELPDAELAEGIVFPMADEAARTLAEGVARRPSDIDLVEVHGYGFPRWRGGLMHYAETRGLPEIVARLEAMAALGQAPAPSDPLRDAAACGRFGG